MTKSIIVAIDEQDKASFNRILDSLNPNLCMVKIGSVSFNTLGHDIIYSVAGKGFDIFLDLKLHDIPNTVKKSIDVIIDSIVESVAKNEKVEIRGFGTFSKKYIRPRKFVNPRTKEVSYLGETATLHFKPSKSLLEK